MSDLVLEARDLVRRYRARGTTQVALDHVDLQVRRGSIHGIIGASGAGKTTLLRCLATLERPDAGRILLGGRDLAQLRGSALRLARRELGTVYQQLHLLASRTASDNVALPLVLAGRPRPAIQARVAELLSWVGLAHRGHSYPRELSGGERQRIAAARALSTAPRVLLCDEPTSALDPATANAVLDLLRRARDELGVTVVLITHARSAVHRICDRVTELAAGRVIGDGTVAEVLGRSHDEREVVA